MPPRWYTEAPHWILAPPFPAEGDFTGAYGDLYNAATDPGEYKKPTGPSSSYIGTTAYEDPLVVDPPKLALLQLSSQQDRAPADGTESAKALLLESERLESRAVASQLRLAALHRRLLALTEQVTDLVVRHSEY